MNRLYFQLSDQRIGAACSQTQTDNGNRGNPLSKWPCVGNPLVGVRADYLLKSPRPLMRRRRFKGAAPDGRAKHSVEHPFTIATR
jgi:hypothetical protein